MKTPAGRKPVAKLLGVLAARLITTGRLKQAKAKQAIQFLVDDLHEYPLDAIELAIYEHRKKNPYWPDLADLTPVLEKNLFTEDHLWDQRCWEYFKLGTHHWESDCGPPPNHAGTRVPAHIVDKWRKWKLEQNEGRKPS